MILTMILRLITGLAILICCVQAVLFIGPLFLFGELCTAAQDARRADRLEG